MGLDAAYRKLTGAGGRLFADPQPAPDEVSFQVDNTSAAYYESVYYKLHRKDLQPIPRPRVPVPRIDLGDVLGAEFMAAIAAAKQISFHAVGDTGAAKVNSFQTAAQALEHEANVAAAMVRDVNAGGATGPAFFLHLGDVVYNFGEGQYYYDQFYEPFRAYDRPIFAIPGNHDGMVFGDKPDLPQVETLTAFLRNFCAERPGPSPDAGTVVRSTMDQPGVYFTLDAPFVSIVGLYTNVLESPGVISSQGGRYPVLAGDEQLHFLRAELARLAPARKAGERAVIVVCHHPPASVDAGHGGGSGLADDIDSASRAAGFWPDAVLSGHAHLYQRFTRRVDEREIPYIVAGSGGFAATQPIGGLPETPVTVGEYTLDNQPVVDFGYLGVTVDMTGRDHHLAITFNDRTNTRIHDTTHLNLKTGKILAR
ncbi:MAG TPA: metallophosphoesterase [Gaiellaceae bacterium]